MEFDILDDTVPHLAVISDHRQSNPAMRTKLATYQHVPSRKFFIDGSLRLIG